MPSQPSRQDSGAEPLSAEEIEEVRALLAERRQTKELLAKMAPDRLSGVYGQFTKMKDPYEAARKAKRRA